MMPSPELAEPVEHLTPFDPCAVLAEHAQTFTDLAASYDRAGGSHSAILADQFRRSAAQLRAVQCMLAHGQLDADAGTDWVLAAGTWRARVELLLDGLELAHARGLQVTLSSLRDALVGMLHADDVEQQPELQLVRVHTPHPGMPA